MKFSISKKLLDAYPTVEEHIVVATGLNNEIAGKWILDKMREAEKNLQEKGKDILKEPRYARWISTYEDITKEAKLDPKGFLPSHVALARRVLEGKELPNINPIVNLYNYYSVKFGVPIGGENLGAVYGDMVLDYMTGDEKFMVIGGSDVEMPAAGEVAWKDDHSVTCRMWAWRQCERTKLGKDVDAAYFIFDGFSDLEGVDLADVVKRFVADLEDKFGAKVQVETLSAEKPSAEFDFQTKDISEIDIDEDIKKYAAKKSEQGKKTGIMKRKLIPLGLIDEEHLSQRISKIADEVLADMLEGESGTSFSPSMNEKFGDASSIAAIRNSATGTGQPRDVAEKYVRKLKGDVRISEVIDEISVAGNGFINIKYSQKFLINELIKSLQAGSEYGTSPAGKGKTMLVESPSINPNAAAHVGHLLNLFIGRSLARLFTKAGFNVSVDNLINDRGIKICMAMWGVKTMANGGTPESEGIKPDQFVGNYYVKAKDSYKNDPQAKKKIDQMLRDWEASVPEVVDLWKQVVGWAYDGHRQTLERLHEELGHTWLESELYQKGKDIIDSHLGDGVIEKLPDGAVIGRLESYGLPDAVLLRSDGTSLYHTQDIYLTLQKIEKFDPWRAIWVVGNEQILHFQQLFALLDALGILDLERVYHFAYGIIVDKKGVRIGKGKSDSTADAILDQMKAAAETIMADREIDVDLNDEDAVAEAVGVGALRYAFLSRDPYRDVVYDPDSALSFTGKSGPYVMYAYTRGQSVLRKVLGNAVDNYGVSGEVDLDPSSVSIEEPERKLLLQLLHYPEVVLMAANNYAPNTLAEYLYDTASAFNNFYEKLTIAGAKGDQKTFRIMLTKLTTNVLKSGLEVLGIEVMEKM